MKLLSPDSGLMRGLSDLADAVWINVLMLLSCIPVVTVGAALTAAHDVCRRSLEGRGHVTADYCKAFRANFLKATGLWLFFGPMLALLVWAWIFLQITPLLVVKFGLSVVWVLGFEWVWALQARFENSLGRTLWNSFIFSVSHIGSSLTMIAMDALYLGLIAASWVYMPQGLFLLVILGFGSLIMLHTPVLERAFARYVRQESWRGANQSIPGER
ncbi:hypothetical protein BACT_0090 [Bifidobacterium actinocoloniiforme DSM 22766]|uniref:Beta-carotene 15,15'-monooxygenase n=1 Tax=Bifidobacterium actinocoloniiforme DSM 22766 TaxID=1437605 RepID=A0A086YYB0_9BIFI|nr:YesL family protein [Bifidobacterium actinocoloniiforme]AKV55825.1 beta-carotene 15,15'-monooxygenase [Bifidobacterium actinocoloniiforme DSM 22766]KFI39260.1 hypothetical protein BACT_0090 [Bifidobacterium actinocoloniiforme DSM 22766]